MKNMKSGVKLLAHYFKLSAKFKFTKNTKTEFVCFSKPKDQRYESHDTISIDNNVIKRSNECKHTGIPIDSSLIFLSHCKRSSKNVKRYKTPHSNRTQLPASSLKILLHSIALSLLFYSSLFIQHIKNYDDFTRQAADLRSQKVFLPLKCNYGIQE